MQIDNQMQKNLIDKLKEWYSNYHPTRACIQAVLNILNSEGLNVPISLTGLLKHGKSKAVLRTVSPGKYLHIGLEKQLRKIPECALSDYDEIILDIGVDGLPLYKSSLESLWPIIGRIVNIRKIEVFLIGTYMGKNKPLNVDTYLHDLVTELKILKEIGLVLNSREFKFEIRAFICDTPARSFMCDTMGHNALAGCGKCYQRGERIKNVTTFKTKSSLLRTDNDFNERKQPDFHKEMFKNNPSSLQTIGIKMITQFPLEPMHLLDLGVMKKMLHILFNGKIDVSITTDRKKMLSTRLLSLSSYITNDFQRKPRSFDEISRWKATEFRQFILYTGPVVLKSMVDENFYYEFLLLHSAYRLLSTPANFASNVITANELLTLFVENFPIIFGENSVTFNIHNLLHISQCVVDMDVLPSFSAYDFENFMQNLKRNIRKPSKILEQVHNRYYNADIGLREEQKRFIRNRHGRIISYRTKNWFLSTNSPDDFCCTSISPFTLIKVTGFLDEAGGRVKGLKIQNLKNFFDEPLQSMTSLGICTGEIKSDLDDDIFNVNEIVCKIMCLPYENTHVLIPLLHSCMQLKKF